jgi:hypothetical protein
MEWDEREEREERRDLEKSLPAVGVLDLSGRQSLEDPPETT